MSKLVENALEKVRNTTWYFERGILEIRDAVVVFSNFAGQKNRWGSESRNFNIVLPLDLLEFLQKLDLTVNIHKYPKEAAGTEEEPCFYYINAKANMDNEFPPLVTLYTKLQRTDPETGAVMVKTSKSTLNDGTISCLDKADLESVGIKLNVRESKANPGFAVFYLREMKAVQVKVPDFGGMYDELDQEIEDNPAVQLAHESAAAE